MACLKAADAFTGEGIWNSSGDLSNGNTFLLDWGYPAILAERK